MPRKKMYQAYNDRTSRWVKYELKDGRAVIRDVKQKEPQKPFKGVRKRGNRRG